MDKFIAILLIIISFIIRPSVLGSKYTSFGVILALITLGIYLFKYKNIRLNKINMNILESIYLLFLVILLNSIIMKSQNMDFVLKSLITNIIIIFVFGIILANKKIRKKYFNNLIYVFLIFTISYYITLFLSQFIGIANLLVLKTNAGYSEGLNNIYFPLTPVYGFMTTGNLIIIRASGLFRESGIYQMYLIWAYFYLENNRGIKKYYKIILILGIISTFSTSGIFIFMITLAVKKILELNNRNLILKLMVGVVVFIVAILLLIYTPNIGLADKSVTHSTSITDRLDAMNRGIKLLFQYPFGTGIYNIMNFDVGLENTGINLIAGSYKVGIIGIILAISIFIRPIKNIKNWRLYIICTTPILITLLFMQPILDAPFIYILLMANYDHDI